MSFDSNRAERRAERLESRPATNDLGEPGCPGLVLRMQTAGQPNAAWQKLWDVLLTLPPRRAVNGVEQKSRFPYNSSHPDSAGDPRARLEEG